jgi:hypothetical protein
MAYLLIGIVITAALFITYNYIRKNGINITWWQWGITLLGFGYATLVLAVIVEFLYEGSIKGAVVMGSIMGFFALVWGVLLKRFVIVRNTK